MPPPAVPCALVHCGLTVHSSRTRFVASRQYPMTRAGRLNSGVRRQGAIVADYSLRFDDPALQARFLSELARKGVPHHISGTGAAECSASEWGGVNGVAHTIRDSCFPWYFSWFDPESAAQDFLARLATVRASVSTRASQGSGRIPFGQGIRDSIPRAIGGLSCRLTIHSSRTRFAGRLNSGVRPLLE